MARTKKQREATVKNHMTVINLLMEQNMTIAHLSRKTPRYFRTKDTIKALVKFDIIFKTDETLWQQFNNEIVELPYYTLNQETVQDYIDYINSL